MPQGSVLGPLLFVIFINDLDEGIVGWISKFADDTKIGGVVDGEEGCHRLQEDLDRLQSWAERWRMEFNAEKCEVIHFGRNKRCVEYRANGRTLNSVDEQRDLGVCVHRSLKVGNQVDKAVKKAYGVLAFIGRGIEFRSRSNCTQLWCGRTWSTVCSSGPHITGRMWRLWRGCRGGLPGCCLVWRGGPMRRD